VDTKQTACDKSVTVEPCKATSGDVLVASVAPADVQPAYVPAVEAKDVAATTAVAVGASSTAVDHVVATDEGAVEEGSLSVPSSPPTDEPPANAALLKGTRHLLFLTRCFPTRWCRSGRQGSHRPSHCRR